MLDGISKNISLDLRSSLLTLGRAQASLALLSLNRSLVLAVFLGVLLRSKYNRLASLHPVNPVYHFVEPPHLLELLGIDVEEVLLDGRVRADTHDDDSGFLVLVALAVDFLQHLIGRLDDGDAGACRGDEPLLLEVPVLRQVLAESVRVQEYADDGGHRFLHPQLLGTAGGIV